MRCILLILGLVLHSLLLQARTTTKFSLLKNGYEIEKGDLVTLNGSINLGRGTATTYYGTGPKLRLDSVVSTATGKFEYIYDSKGNNIQAIEYGEITECIYDDAGNLLRFTNDGKYRTEFIYDSTRTLTRTIYSQRNDTVSPWTVAFENDCQHNKDLNIVFVRLHSIENCAFYFDPSGKILHIKDAVTDSIDFKYDQKGDIVSRTKYFRDHPDYIWVDAEKQEYSYDPNRNLITELTYLPKTDPPDGNLVLSMKSEYFYDDTYETKDLFLPYVFRDFIADRYLMMSNKWNFLLNYKIDERINYKNPAQWTTDRQMKYYYSDHLTTQTEQYHQGEIAVYPNPAKEYFEVGLEPHSPPAVIELVDLQGRIVLSEEIGLHNQIQVRHLQRGLYIYKVHPPNLVTTGKILLQ